MRLLGMLGILMAGCMENQQPVIEKATQALTAEEDERSCSTSKAEGYLQGAVIKADPDRDFVPFGEDDHECGISFVELYQYVNGVYTEKVKAYCQNYIGPSECQLPQEMTNCFFDFQKKLFNLMVVVPSMGYEAREASWSWAGLQTQYVIKSQTLKEALDTAMGHVGKICRENQGDAIDKIVSQLQMMPVSLEVRDTFHAAERVKEAQRKAKVDPFHLVRGFSDNCYKNLGVLLPPNVLYNHFPLTRAPKIDLENDLETVSQLYTCETSQYSMCRVLSVAKAETGHILTNGYTYRFSTGILALRQPNGNSEFERESRSDPFDNDHPYPLIPSSKVPFIQMGVDEIMNCFREKLLNGMFFSKEDYSFQKENPIRIKTVDYPAKYPSTYFALYGFARASGNFQDSDNPCAYTEASP